MNVITDKQLKTNLARNLKQTLESRAITPYRLAKLIEEPQNSVYRICRGDNVPNAVILARIAEALDVTIDELLVGNRNRARAAG
jgi:transcriptional regulator with XRE-family HTH domain